MAGRSDVPEAVSALLHPPTGHVAGPGAAIVNGPSDVVAGVRSAALVNHVTGAHDEALQKVANFVKEMMNVMWRHDFFPFLLSPVVFALSPSVSSSFHLFLSTSILCDATAIDQEMNRPQRKYNDVVVIVRLVVRYD
mmetsp:Transcript_13598/g.29444  ORF Transcript_13598/g.29444 Transcript_13598/m.29444 type:complete len:137 (-) Transcript_13598:67-477(-)